MADLAPVLKQRFCDANNDPLVGGKLYSYIAGTSTPKATFLDYEGTPNQNPITLDANGECDLRLGTGLYKFTLKNAALETIWTVNKVSLPTLGGNGVPGGGLEDQVLKKASDADFDLVWADEAGGVEVVADITARNAIVADDRYDGLIVYVISERVDYQLQGGILDANWVSITGLNISAAQALTNGATLTIANCRRQIIPVSGTVDGNAFVLPNGNKDRDELFLEGYDDIFTCVLSTTGNVAAGGTIVFQRYTNRHFIWNNSLTKWIMVGAY